MRRSLSEPGGATSSGRHGRDPLSSTGGSIASTSSCTDDMTLTQVVHTFKKSREYLQRLYENCQIYCSQVNEIYERRCRPEDRGKLVLLKDDDDKKVQQILQKDPVIIVSGMRNAGKTSILNELLEGDKLVSESITNTGRMTKIVYSSDECIKLRAPDGKILWEGEYTRPQMKRLAEVDRTKRKNNEEIRAVVEVGLNHELLRNGVSLVDLPGLDENEDMDDLVFDAMDGVLQTPIYIIDGKDGVREPDVQYLLRLKIRMGSLDDVLFVCNKVDVDLEAHRLNAPSDDSGDELPPIPDAKKYAEERKKVVEKRLENSALRVGREGSVYGLAAKRVQSARVRGHVPEKHDHAVESFNFFRERLIDDYKRCMNSQIYGAVEIIAAVQEKLYTLIQDERNLLERMVQEAGVAQEVAEDKYEYLTNAAHRMKNNVADWFKFFADANHIKKAGMYLPFSGHDKTKCYQNLCRLAACAFLDTAISPTLNELWSQLIQDISWVSVHINESTEMVYYFIGAYISNLNHIEFQEQVIEFLMVQQDKREWEEDIKKLLTDYLVTTAVANQPQQSAGEKLDEKWKGETALAIYKSFNTDDIAEMVIENLLERLRDEYDSFQTSLSSIHALSKLRLLSDRQEMRDTLLNDLSGFAFDCYLTKSLLSTLREGVLPTLPLLASGTSSDVFDYDADTVAKKFHSNVPVNEICIRHSFALFGTPVPGLVEVNDVIFDESWEPVYILRRYKCRLDEALQEGLRQYGLRNRLQALLNVCKTVDALMSKGLEIRHVYPRYFLVDDERDGRDRHLILAYNVLKYSPHEQDESLAVQLAKLLALLFRGWYGSLTPDSNNEEYMDVLDDSVALSPNIRRDAEAMLKKYLFPGVRDLSMAMFIDDLEALMATAGTSARVDDCRTS